MNKVEYQSPTPLDATDPLRAFRSEFHFPKADSGKSAIYLCGNSLGLQPHRTRELINGELDAWAELGVEGHFRGHHPWLPYHENVTNSLANLVGARPSEVVAMNGLTANLHLMMVSFYRPEKGRYRILVEAGAFPSDQYAVASQVRFHGYDPAEAVIELKPRPGEDILRPEDILEVIRKEGHSIALVMLGNVNYLTGQAFDMAAIAREGHTQGCKVGFNLAHGAGNLRMRLHDWGVDFAVWCSYKYLNSGPGGIAGAFVHEKHGREQDLPRFAGWWGHNKQTRFKMGPDFDPLEGAEGWQLSNPPIFQLAALRASLELFDRAGMDRIREKSERLTSYLESGLATIEGAPFEVITPSDPAQRGCQLSLKVRRDPKGFLAKLGEAGVICDFREPNIIRVAPAPLYNSFEDIHLFIETLKKVRA